MKTLIVGDIHLCTSRNSEDVFLAEWLRSLVSKTKPEHIVFAGDTFELSFCTQERFALKHPEDILRNILALHHSFFDFLRGDANLRKLTFLVGEHDYSLLKTLRTQICLSFPEKEIFVGEYFYDRRAKLLAFHGHQLDYNLIPSYDSSEVLTDKLTRVFEDFIFQEPTKTALVLNAFEHQRFSFWYAAGRVPDYIEATSKIFGHDQDIYYRGLSLLLKSDFLKEWLKDLDNPFNRKIGNLARLLSFLPCSALHRVSRLWWAFAQRTVKNRVFAILKGEADRTLISIPENLTVDKLVTGHAHHNGAIEFRDKGVPKAYYCASSPRWYVRGIKEGQLELHRDSGFVVIDSNGRVSYTASSEDRRLPLAAVA